MSVKEHVIERVSAFPTLPIVAQRLVQVVSDPRTTPGDIADVIRLDPALTANVLKAANSAYFGFRHPISSFSEALFRLGTAWIYQTAVSSLIYSNMQRPASGYDMSSQDLWKHSAGVAIIADNLAKQLNIKDVGAIFTAGLIHDMGKLALEESVAESYDEISGLVTQDDISFEQAERKVLGIDHAEAGALIAEKWNFPEPLVNGVRWHHDPDHGPDGSQLVDVVHIADVTCLMQGLGLGRDGLQYRPSKKAVERLNLTNTMLEIATAQLLDALEYIENVFSEPSTSPMPVR